MTIAQVHNDKLYLTGPLKVINPSSDEIASFGFAHSVAQSAPNEKILWLSGQYVEAETANRNGQMWTQDELAIKSLTTRLMPITMMHDYRTAVGVIADAKLNIHEAADDGGAATPSSIDTVLAVWAHRFPEEAEEIRRNHEQGSLMQSMECEAPSYECSECAQVFVKPVNANDHCEHLQRGESARILRDVTFTGTGLIFGSRGARGANPKASLDTVRAEVAQWSDERNGVVREPNKGSTVTDITISRDEYDALKARPSAEDLESAQSETTKLAEAKAELEKAVDKAEIDLKEANDKLEAANAKISEADEASKADEMAKERLAAMPKKLADKLPESIASRVGEQARSMSDDEWESRIAELAELTDVKADADDPAGDTFSEAAMSRFNGNGNNGDEGSTLTSGEVGRSIANILGSK